MHIHIHTYDPPTKKKGNAKVLAGHWFMEIHGNCDKKRRGERWDLPKLAVPLFRIMSLYFSNLQSDTHIGP